MRPAPGEDPSFHYPSYLTLNRVTKRTSTIKLFYFPVIGVGSTRNREQLTDDGSVLCVSKPILRREEEAIKHIVATIFSAQDALRDLAPEQRWPAMGNLLGAYG